MRDGEEFWGINFQRVGEPARGSKFLNDARW